jgi:hypothetical protein
MATRYKYPRTPHFPWSRGPTDDDKVLKNCAHFVDKTVVVTEKMDGENTSLYCDGIHARSLDSRYHESRAWVKALHGRIKHLIPVGWRICGENMFAVHSIEYDELPSYFLAFSVWDENNVCLGWDDTVSLCSELELATVPVIQTGKFWENDLRRLGASLNPNKVEGYVVRNIQSFDYKSFAKNIAKYVRRNHVTTDEHWMNMPIQKNGLRESL